MICEAMRERLAAKLNGELSPDDGAELDRHLAQCEECAAYVADVEKLWSELDDEAVPSERLRRRFTTWLGAESERHEPRSWRRRTIERWLPLAATLLFGVGIGYVVRGPERDELESLRGEVAELHETVAESLLAQASVSKRLKGVAYGREYSNDDTKIADALIATLYHDPSVNVRLAAIEALAPLAARSARIDELVAAVAVQQSPLVQLSLIDALLEARNKEVTAALERLIDDPRLEAAVSAYLRDRILRSV